MDFAASVLSVPAQFVHTPNAVVVNFGLAGSHLSESVFVKHATGGLDLGNVSALLLSAKQGGDIAKISHCSCMKSMSPGNSLKTVR